MSPRLVFSDTEDIIEVCPYSLTRCKLPAGTDWPIREKAATAETLHDWKKAVSKSVFCPYLGDQLTKSQYRHRKLGKLA